VTRRSKALLMRVTAPTWALDVLIARTRQADRKSIRDSNACGAFNLVVVNADVTSPVEGTFVDAVLNESR